MRTGAEEAGGSWQFEQTTILKNAVVYCEEISMQEHPYLLSFGRA